MKVAIIGGGAGGFFSAIQVKENYPNAEVTIFEKTSKVLSKVKISGGGRCNVTNACTDIVELSKAYPRGERFLKKAFHQFNTKDTQKWFINRNVPLVVQKDACIFPKSQQSQSIIDCFLSEVKRLNIKIELNCNVLKIIPILNRFEIHFKDKAIQKVDKIIVATGGSPKRKGLEWLENLGHTIENPVPSLFTFNMPNEWIVNLMGVVVENVTVSIQKTKLKSKGSLLITHWGMSGPAILKLSAFGARVLNEMDYNFKIQVNWISTTNTTFIATEIKQIIQTNPNKKLRSIKLFSLPTRLWNYLVEKIAFSEDKKWSELGKKGINKLINILTNDVYQVSGKTTFKEEFVTCGGVSLKKISVNSMQSKIVKNLYFVGEVLDIDGITGGYNFQAAWTTAFIAGKLLDK